MLFVISATNIDITDVLHFSGAVCNCYLAIIMPCLMYMKYYGSQVSLPKRIGLWTFIILGSTFTVMSMVSSIYSIANRKYEADGARLLGLYFDKGF
jgi:NADH:ubiquinone oxidoreductase subunit 6 (subunit J)